MLQQVALFLRRAEQCDARRVAVVRFHTKNGHSPQPGDLKRYLAKGCADICLGSVSGLRRNGIALLLEVAHRLMAGHVSLTRGSIEVVQVSGTPESLILSP